MPLKSVLPFTPTTTFSITTLAMIIRNYYFFTFLFTNYNVLSFIALDYHIPYFLNIFMNILASYILTLIKKLNNGYVYVFYKQLFIKIISIIG